MTDIKDEWVADLYITMIRLIKQVEKTGELSDEEVDRLSFKCWVYLQEQEKKK